MATTLSHDSTSPYAVEPEIRKISPTAPNRWLQKGLEDFKEAGLTSFVYGLVFAIAGALMIGLTSSNPVFVMAIVSGFFLIGPLAATGFYDISHRVEDNKKPTLLHAMSTLRFNTLNLISFALILGLLMAVWTGASALIVSLFFEDVSLVTGGWGALLNGEQSLPFIAVFMFSGLVLAVIASAISIVCVPLMSHRRSDTITAIVILGVLMFLWTRLMTLMIGVFFEDSALIEGGWTTLFSSPQILPFLFTFMLTGLVFAVITFMISVVSVPLITHHKVGVMTAINTSVRAVMKNPVAMLRWAALITVLVTLGMALFFVGLAIALPIIGHASWHAYREIVEDKHLPE